MQGVYLDTDGSLIKSTNLPAGLLPATVPAGAGSTWHSAVNNNMFDPKTCVIDKETPPNGAWCGPSLTFRRINLNEVQPVALAAKDLFVVSLETNRTSTVKFSKTNEWGYMFTVPTGKDHWFHWDMPFRLDPENYT